MQLTDVQEWKDRAWTCSYQAALFERDTVKLCARLWDAQLAIRCREQEIDRNSEADVRELLALRKAMSILRDLRRLRGIDQENDHIRNRIGDQPSSSHPRNTRIRRTVRISKQVSSQI